MIGRTVRAFFRPIPSEKRAILQRRWEELPESLRTPWQVVGQQFAHCSYTLGPAYCSFGCTHCYLPANANRAPLPSLAEMKEQIDANRRIAGPSSGLQITGGDVVDAYLRADRGEDLIEILRYAAERGTVPMLMTHGQKLLEHPDYFRRLVIEGRLRKVALHIDMTQAGRVGFPIRSLREEADLHPLRQQFVDLLLKVRKETGKSVSAAHTVTVTSANIGSIGQIFEWLAGAPERLKVFKMVSLQPEADVGRTRMNGAAVTPESTWSEVCKALGCELPRDSFWFGHPDCSSMSTVLLDSESKRAYDTVGNDEAARAYWGYVLRHFGGVGTRGDQALDNWARRIGLLFRHPGFVPRTLGFVRHRMRGEGLGPKFLLRAARGRVQALNIVMHNFMSSDEVLTADSDETVRDRLAACSFRGAVRRNGSWEPVPMCAMNVEERESLYEAQIDRSGRS